MSYLLVQVLVCLLIAGLIGLIIGWLLRGGCDKTLLKNDEEWNIKLQENKNQWSKRIETLKNENDINIETIKQELVGTKNELESTKVTLVNQESNTNQEKVTLANRLKDLQLEHNNAKNKLSKELSGVREKLMSAEVKSQSSEIMKEETRATIKDIQANWSDKLKKKEDELSTTKTQFALLTKQLKTEKENINRDWKNKFQTLIHENSTRNNDLKGKLARVENKINNLNSQLELGVNSKPQLLSVPNNDKKDNLTYIRGIGTVLEERLNTLGIYHFEQIASWTKDQEMWIEEQMSFHGRVQREEWINQAKDLASGIETSFSKRVKDGDVPSSKQ